MLRLGRIIMADMRNLQARFEVQKSVAKARAAAPKA